MVPADVMAAITASVTSFLRDLAPGGTSAPPGTAETVDGLAEWLVVVLMALFLLGILHALTTHARARATLRREVDRPKPSLAEVGALAAARGRGLPFLVVLVPARDESAVIANTITRLAGLDYPPDRYAVVVIVDERERAEGSRVTTRQIAERMAERLNSPPRRHPLLHVVEVPGWFSGRFGDRSRTHARSTKGRALNWALGWVREHGRLSGAEMFGVLDADGRLHRQVLCEVASHRIERGARLLQGPVFQISNLGDVGLVGKAAGIELSLYHLSTLPRRLMSRRNLPRFLAGTNYFVDLRLMLEAGGWNERALVEDAELGLRLFFDSGVRAEWLSCHEIEQTPPDRRAYLRQRERWALGHFELLPAVRASRLSWTAKTYLRGLIVGAVFKTFLDAGLPILGWLALLAGWAAGMPEPMGWAMLGLLAGSVFVWDYLGRGAAMLNRYAPRPLDTRALLGLRLLFAAAMPWLMIVQAWPRLAGLARYLSRRHSGEWVKTPRTVEAALEGAVPRAGPADGGRGARAGGPAARTAGGPSSGQRGG